MTKARTIAEEIYFEIEFAIKVAEKYAKSQLKPQGEKDLIRIINELINIIEHPNDNDKGWKQAVIQVAKEQGYTQPTLKHQ